MRVDFEDQSEVILEMTPDGMILLSSGSADMGQSVYTGQALVAAHTLGVDIETGEVKVEKMWAAHDVGKALDKTAIEGQIDGGVVMGIGFALMEELLQEEGYLLNNRLSEYIVPLANDIPEIEHIIVEVPEPTGPLGAKGIGEPATIPTAPAIANAVADALSIRMTQIPMTSERIWRALTK